MGRLSIKQPIWALPIPRIWILCLGRQRTRASTIKRSQSLSQLGPESRRYGLRTVSLRLRSPRITTVTSTSKETSLWKTWAWRERPTLRTTVTSSFMLSMTGSLTWRWGSSLWVRVRMMSHTSGAESKMTASKRGKSRIRSRRLNYMGISCPRMWFMELMSRTLTCCSSWSMVRMTWSRESSSRFRGNSHFLSSRRPGCCTEVSPSQVKTMWLLHSWEYLLGKVKPWL